jgi:hypothetical protein
MSWDVFTMRCPKEYENFADGPNGWHPEDLGTVQQVRAAVVAVIPEVTWYEDGWGSGEGNGFSVEVPPLGTEDELINHFTLMFRGGGDAAVVAMAVAEALDARALGGGEFLDPENAVEALSEWHRFRARAVGVDRSSPEN